MGQKANPIALRLHTNRTIDSVWYSEFKYSEFAFYDYTMRLFLQSVYSSAKILPARILSHHYAKRHNIDVLASSSYEVKNKPAASNQKQIFSRFHKYSFSKKESIFLNLKYSRLLLLNLFECEKRNLTNLTNLNAITLPDFPVKENLSPLKNHIEGNASYNSGLLTQITAVKIHYLKSANSIALMVAKNLEKKRSFRQIWSTIMEDKETLKENNDIIGLRIVCAGRLNGAEMARLESHKWGRTPLHTFSDRIDYSVGEANTRFGKIGIKVWICYK